MGVAEGEGARATTGIARRSWAESTLLSRKRKDKDRRDRQECLPHRSSLGERRGHDVRKVVWADKNVCPTN